MSEPQAPRAKAQELVYDAMESGDEEKAAQLCRRAMEIHPDCVDALNLLADIECELLRDYVPAKRRAVEAGRRDLGEDYIEQMKGEFWLDLDTRPYMRAMAGLADALLQWGQREHVDEAIDVYEQMLELNPNDNQGVRDPLVACYLHRKRYREAGALLERFEDGMAVACWARVLLAYASGEQERASTLLNEAREANPHVELYLTGRKRRPRKRPGSYSPGQDSEAVYCVNVLAEAWNKHSKAKAWLKERCDTEPSSSEMLFSSEDEALHPPDLPSTESVFMPRTEVPDELHFRELKKHVADGYRKLFTQIIDRIDTFCDAYLNDEYKVLCREMATSICQEDFPTLKGKPESWAAGVVYAVGRVNFLSDPSHSPCVKSEDIAKGVGVSPATMQAKAKVIREALDLIQMDPDWSVPSMMEHNPLVWMVEVDGLIVDLRMAPREVQVAAYEQGLIPYIPADREEA